MANIQNRTKLKEEQSGKRKFAEIDLSVDDLGSQPIAFAQWYSDLMIEMTIEQLTIDDTDPKVIKLFEETYELQRKIMEQGKLDWNKLADTYITI